MSRRLDRARCVGDPPADEVIEQLASQGRLEGANRVLAGLIRNGAALPEGLAPSLRSFLEKTSALPSFTDRVAIRRAQTFADRNSVSIAAALFCASLPTAFAAAKGALVLVTSGRMQDDIDRRISETGRFVFDVVSPGGLDPAGCGIRSVQKVRLMHAAVRRRQLEGASGHNTREVPINQEDLLGTLFSFSTVVISALKRLGCEMSARDAEDYYHLWRVVGAMLGVEEALLPPTLEKARALSALIAERQLKPSPHGYALTRVLLSGLERHMPAPCLADVPRQLVEYLLGDRLSEMLGLAGAGARGASPPFAHFSRVTTDHSANGFGRRLLERIIALKLAGARPSFAMPEASPTAPQPPTRRA